MKIDLKSIIKIVRDWLEIFNRLCKPALKHSNCHIEQEIDHERNKLIVKFYLAVIILLFTQILIKKCTVLVGAALIGVCAFKIILLMISCHYNVNYFKICFSLVISFCGPLLMNLNAEGGQRAWLASQMYPPLILFCTGSLHHFGFQAGLQVFLQNFVYPQKMLPYLEMLSSEEYLRMWTKNSTSIMLIQVAITVCLDSILKKAYSKMQIAEKKKEELERQRIFVLGFSHELRNIINSLMGNVKLASLEILSDNARKFLKNADVCAESLLNLINNILDSGKVEIGELEINPTPTNIYNTMDQIWRIFSEQIKEKRLNGNLRFLNNVPQILQVDHYRLMQIFFNLIGNAVKFTEKGSITITVEWVENVEQVSDKNFQPNPFEGSEDDTIEGTLEESHQAGSLSQSHITLPGRCSQKSPLSGARDRKGVLKVTVRDTGSGISREDLDKLFQKFSQVSSDPAKRKLGTGLGLFITKELCERMGGKIQVFSQEGKGSSFIFCLPVTPLPFDRFTQSTPVLHMQKPKAMIVDDEILCRNLLETFFNKLQVDVLSTAQNGLEAYKNYVDSLNRGNRLDLVTMDLTMPLMDGKEAAEKIRQFEVEKGIDPCVLIVVSGNCSESEISKCLDKKGKIRADFFLKKPARLDEIARVISQLKK